MTTKQMRELDEWIHINIFEWTLGRELKYPNRPAYFLNGVQMLACDAPRYSAHPAAAMLVLKKCAEKIGQDGAIEVSYHKWNFSVRSALVDSGFYYIEKSLELATCQFARQLFEKGNQ